jgi:hypothetical protein
MTWRAVLDAEFDAVYEQMVSHTRVAFHPLAWPANAGDVTIASRPMLTTVKQVLAEAGALTTKGLPGRRV